MHFWPECLEKLHYPAFWENSEEPSLKNFLIHRLRARDLKDEVTEHNRYKNELKTILKHYDEPSDIRQKVIGWLKDFKVLFIYCILECRFVKREALFEVYNSQSK